MQRYRDCRFYRNIYFLMKSFIYFFFFNYLLCVYLIIYIYLRICIFFIFLVFNDLEIIIFGSFCFHLESNLALFLYRHLYFLIYLIWIFKPFSMNGNWRIYLCINEIEEVMYFYVVFLYLLLDVMKSKLINK